MQCSRRTGAKLVLKNKLILSVGTATAAAFLLPILCAQLGRVRLHRTMAARRQGKFSVLAACNTAVYRTHIRLAAVTAEKMQTSSEDGINSSPVASVPLQVLN